MSSPKTTEICGAIGDRVRSLREARGLTQESAAGAADIDVKRWQRIESGGVNPTVKTLARIAAAIGTDFWTLVRKPDAGDLGGKPNRSTKRRTNRSDRA